jgi:hypothetical protein
MPLLNCHGESKKAYKRHWVHEIKPDGYGLIVFATANGRAFSRPITFEYAYRLGLEGIVS